MTKFGLAQSVRRVEDPRLLKGGGRYTDDIVLPGMLHGIVLRSPHAAAKLGAIDTTAAASVAGVKAIYTAADLSADGIGPMPCAAPVQNRDGSDMASPPHPALADGAVRHVGDPVAFIVADTREGGARRGGTDRGRLRPSSPPSPISPRRPMPARRWCGPTWRNNIAFDWGIGDKAATDALFATAAHVTRLTVVNNRVIVASMEARAAIADYDAASGRWTLYANTQGGWLIKNLIGPVFSTEPANFRVITPDVGGGFGMKAFLYAEHVLTCYAARKLGRPVKWASDRGEAFLCRHAGPRQRHARRTGDRRGRQIPGAAHAQSRQHGRLSFDLRAVYPDAGRRRACCPASTTSSRSTPTCSACSPTRCRWMPIAAPVVPKATTCWSAWSMPPRAS